MGRYKLINKRQRRRKIMRNTYSRRESIHIENNMVEATKEEMAIKNMDTIVNMGAMRLKA